MNFRSSIFIFLACAAVTVAGKSTLAAKIESSADVDTVLATPALPEMTSKYNRGGTNSLYAGRHRDQKGQIRTFELRDGKAALRNGGGRLIATVTKPVKLNKGAVKQMTVDGKEGTYLWAWNTAAGLSGWMNRADIIDAPAVEAELKTSAGLNPAPPSESKQRLKINTRAGTLALTGLSHINSKGVLPSGGNKGEHYAGRNPAGPDYVYLLFAVPNVQKGGTAKDSMPDGSEFIPALDENGKLIAEVMTMYRDVDLKKPVTVTFLYGRPATGKMYGWIARANVGEL